MTSDESAGTACRPIDRSIDLGPFVPQEDDDVVVCRCEEVTKGEIRRAVHDGLFTMTEVRRFLRAGMGLCQGQSCTKLMRRIMASELAGAGRDLEAETSRAPMRPIEMRVLGNEAIDGKRGEQQ